jgi:hypothetical protein
VSLQLSAYCLNSQHTRIEISDTVGNCSIALLFYALTYPRALRFNLVSSLRYYHDRTVLCDTNLIPSQSLACHKYSSFERL